MGLLFSGAADAAPPPRLCPLPLPLPAPRSACRALVVVAGGGRDLDWSSLRVAAALTAAAAGRLVQLVLHGGARGADRAIAAASQRLGWPEEANRIFGFDGWQRQTLSSRCVSEAKRLIGSNNEGRPQKEGWGVTYIARVRITVNAGAQGWLIREGTGAGHGNRFAEAQGLRRGSGPRP